MPEGAAELLASRTAARAAHDWAAADRLLANTVIEDYHVLQTTRARAVDSAEAELRRIERDLLTRGIFTSVNPATAGQDVTFSVVVSGTFQSPVGFVQLVAPEYRDALRRNVARQLVGIDDVSA